MGVRRMDKYMELLKLKKRYNFIKFRAKQPILDLGGGYGLFLDSQNIDKATIYDLTTNRNNIYNYVEADLTKELPKTKEKFNTIFITEVLEHLPNPLMLLSQAHNLLNDKGVCYISIPYTEIGQDHHHVCRWTKKEILNQTTKLGFTSKVIQSRRRFYGLGFFLPHCWLVLELRKKTIYPNEKNIINYKLNISSKNNKVKRCEK